jgi:hypothetical protein
VEINLAQARAVLELTLAEYSEIRANYWARVYDAVYAYMASSDTITTHKNAMKKAVTEEYFSAAETAYQDGGGVLPMDTDTQEWFASRQAAELGYVDALFQNLKMERAEEGADAIHSAFQHADAYAKTLDSVYANVKCMAAGNLMLTLVGEDGKPPKFPCPECKKYKGKTHRAKWWVAKNLVPGRGSSYSCGGWNCSHVLITRDGRLFTI